MGHDRLLWAVLVLFVLARRLWARRKAPTPEPVYRSPENVQSAKRAMRTWIWLAVAVFYVIIFLIPRVAASGFSIIAAFLVFLILISGIKRWYLRKILAEIPPAATRPGSEDPVPVLAERAESVTFWKTLQDLLMHPAVAFRRLAGQRELGQALIASLGAGSLALAFQIAVRKSPSPDQIPGHPLPLPMFHLPFPWNLLGLAGLVLLLFLFDYVINGLAEIQGSPSRYKALIVCTLWAGVLPHLFSVPLYFLPGEGSQTFAWWHAWQVPAGLGTFTTLLAWELKLFAMFIFTFDPVGKSLLLNVWTIVLQIDGVQAVYNYRFWRALFTYLLSAILVGSVVLLLGVWVIPTVHMIRGLSSTVPPSIAVREGLDFGFRNRTGMDACFDPIRLHIECMHVHCIYRVLEETKDARLCEDIEKKQTQYHINPQFFVTRQDCLDRLTELTPGQHPPAHGDALRNYCTPKKSP